MPNVIFDAVNLELRNDVSFFQQYPTRPFDIRWIAEQGVIVTAGMVLGHFVWPDQPEAITVIVAPAACEGRIVQIHREIELDLLGDGPSQVLLELGPVVEPQTG